MVDQYNSNFRSLDSMVVGVDVGGTKIAAALVDVKGSLHGRVRCPTDVHSSEATLDSIAQAVGKAIAEGGVSPGEVHALGVGIPGLVDPIRGIGVASVNLNWRDVPVKAGLEARLGISCIIENDVKAAALGEARFGAGKGLESLIYLNIGTGIAMAVILENKIYRGSKGMAGEIGHMVIEPDGPLCKCGARGCFEAHASGPAILSRAQQKIQAGRLSILTQDQRVKPPVLTTEDVFHAAAQGDELALETVGEVGENVAFVIQLLALAYAPQRIVLGGGVLSAGQGLLRPVMQSLERLAAQNWVFRELFTPDFVQITKLGDDSGVLGAAALVTPLQ
jgi:glucokinase